MIGNGYEIYFHRRKTFDAKIKKKKGKGHISYDFTTFLYQFLRL